MANSTSHPNLAPRHVLALLLIAIMALPALAAGPQPAATTSAQAVSPFSSSQPFTPANPIDEAVLAVLHEKGLQPAAICSDAVFVRRVYLDEIGTLPTPQETRNFLQDQRPNKRALLIDALMQRPEFAEYWAMKWCDILRVKSEFPINLWPDAVQAYHHWIREAIGHNMPYDQFARALLTSSGSNFRVPPVNFYRAIQGRSPDAIAAAVALTFMGTRLSTWPQAQREHLAAFFSRVAYKHTKEWKEEIVFLDPAPAKPLAVVFPDGKKTTIPADQDPREVFANWLMAPGNQWFARAIVNRVWYWFMGRGIINEPDDIRPDNPPVNPQLLAYLEKQLVSSKYDLRHIYRLILNSHTYQQSCVPHGDLQQAEKYFAVYPVRRLDAEVLIDALDWIGGKGESYSSAIPEPWTFIPESHRTIALADGSITSAFLDKFGRPSRDTGLESERSNQPSDAQSLYLLNSSEVRNKIQNSQMLHRLIGMSRGNRQELVKSIYLTVLSRYPTPTEAATAEKYFQTKGLSLPQATEDVAWALINSKEFLYRH